jgi:cytochrome c-type biogenesis protein
MSTSVRTGGAEPLSVLERFTTFVHAVALVLGFSTIFVLVFGLPLFVVGQALGDFKSVLALIGAIVVIVFGLSTMEVIQISWLNYDTRAQWSGRRDWGYLSSYLMGMFFAAGWSPCIGTTLGAIMTMGINGQVNQGLPLIGAYSLGMGLPFLIVGLGVDRAARQLRKVQRHMRTIKIASGVFLILIGILVLFDALPASLAILGEAFLGAPIFFSWPFPVPSLSLLEPGDQQRLVLRPGRDDRSTRWSGCRPPAFTAGLLSFLSPCVLLLVPACVGYLSVGRQGA